MSKVKTRVASDLMVIRMLTIYNVSLGRSVFSFPHQTGLRTSKGLTFPFGLRLLPDPGADGCGASVGCGSVPSLPWTTLYRNRTPVGPLMFACISDGPDVSGAAPGL